MIDWALYKYFIIIIIIINCALSRAPRKFASFNGYRRKEESLSFLIMLDLRVVSVEKTQIIL